MSSCKGFRFILLHFLRGASLRFALFVSLYQILYKKKNHLHCFFILTSTLQLKKNPFLGKKKNLLYLFLCRHFSQKPPDWNRFLGFWAGIFSHLYLVICSSGWDTDFTGIQGHYRPVPASECLQLQSNMFLVSSVLYFILYWCQWKVLTCVRKLLFLRGSLTFSVTPRTLMASFTCGWMCFCISSSHTHIPKLHTAMHLQWQWRHNKDIEEWRLATSSAKCCISEVRRWVWAAQINTWGVTLGR